MKKLAIYGDSFSSTQPIFDLDDSNLSKIGPPWPLLLSNYSVTNFSYPGTDLYYSYKHFLDNYTQFDQNIFVITSINRISIKYNNEWINIISNPRKHPKKNKVTTILTNYLTVQDLERERLFKKLILNDIKSKDKNVYIIDAFDDIDGLRLITKMENVCWGFDYLNMPKTTYDLRYCHMTDRNNEILAKQITADLDNKVTKFKLNIDTFYKPNKNDKDIYIVNYTP